MGRKRRDGFPCLLTSKLPAPCGKKKPVSELDVADSLAVVEADLAPSQECRSFLWSSCAQGAQAFAPHCGRGTLPGMVEMEKGKGSEPPALLPGCRVGAQERPVFSVPLVAGSGRPRGKRVRSWIS